MPGSKKFFLSKTNSFPFFERRFRSTIFNVTSQTVVTEIKNQRESDIKDCCFQLQTLRRDENSSMRDFPPEGKTFEKKKNRAAKLAEIKIFT